MLVDWFLDLGQLILRRKKEAPTEMKKEMARPPVRSLVPRKNNPTIYIRVAGAGSLKKQPHHDYLRVAGGVLLRQRIFWVVVGHSGMAEGGGKTGGGGGRFRGGQCS